MNRRRFLKTAGLGSISIAAGCTSEPEKTLYSLVEAPDDMVTGRAAWYASTCRECPAGCGIVVKNREGRCIKIEGNPLHPINRGRLCMRGQAALQGLYHPDRIRTPLLRENGRWHPISFARAQDLLAEKTTAAFGRGPGRIRLLTEMAGDSLLALFREFTAAWNAPPPLVFEPFAYESLKTANENVFDIEGLATCRIDQADVLIAFGADFLETWLSPVEYARRFKAMHALQDGSKGIFFHVAPYQSLTAANADRWMACRPGGEVAVVLGLIQDALLQGRGRALPNTVRAYIQRIAASYTRERVLWQSGLPPADFDTLRRRLLAARTPLLLGTGTGSPAANALQTNMAVNLLNYILDPELKRIDFSARHRIEMAAKNSQTSVFFEDLLADAVDLLLINNANPVFSLPPGGGAREAIGKGFLYVVCFSNFMDETAEMADLIFPTAMPLETWDEYAGKQGILSTLQPVSGKLTAAPPVGDVLLNLPHTPFKDRTDYKSYLLSRLIDRGVIRDETDWVQTIRRGGHFENGAAAPVRWSLPATVADAFHAVVEPPDAGLVFIAAPSIRFFDGRGANRPWLCEIPDPLTKIAWQSPVWVHPTTLAARGMREGDVIKIQSRMGGLEAPVYETEGVRPNVLVMGMGQGHTAYGRYAQDMGVNPVRLFAAQPQPEFGGLQFSMEPVSIHDTGRSVPLAHTDGSRIQHGRKIALRVSIEDLDRKHAESYGLTMDDFPLTLPLPRGYDPARDFYPSHDHDRYRWAMVVDLDRCIGCGACAAACYAENNIGVVGREQIARGREMAWIRVERYLDPRRPDQIIFLPMMCQHCDNAPCESVCPVYAPHHSKEGLNNQIYNRCIGTRFCAQNCPYKVRRFNWFTWQWPEPLNLQLNPDVTVRSKGVMEKCSFCIQRIKAAHGIAKNERRAIADGDITPACVQTCPTGALTFGNLLDARSRVSRMVGDPRAYQVMGYLNTKPAVIYLKKVDSVL